MEVWSVERGGGMAEFEIPALVRHEHSYCVGQTTGELVRRMRGLRRSADLRTEWQYVSDWLRQRTLTP